MSNGRTAYEAYREALDGKDPDTGQEIPEWDDLDRQLRIAYTSAGDAVFNVAYSDGYEDGVDAGLEKAEEDYEVEELEA